MTRFAKVIEKGDDFNSVDWHPWINCDANEDREQFARLVFHRWVRDRGGIHDDDIGLVVCIYQHCDTDAKYPDGRPASCYMHEIKVGPPVERKAVQRG